MKALIQRVTQASVTVAGEPVGEIGSGLLVFLGVEPKDKDSDTERLAKRLLNYRVFADDEGRMNRSLLETGFDILVVSQFTLVANTTKGSRPGFSGAAPPDQAKRLYDHFCDLCRLQLPHVATGRFGADMQVLLQNDGPVTFLLEV